MPDDTVRELEVYKMLARLGIELGAGVIPRYGLMSVTVPLALEELASGVERLAWLELSVEDSAYGQSYALCAGRTA